MTDLSSLERRLGRGAVTRDPDVLAGHSHDLSTRALLRLRAGTAPEPPLGVVFPSSTEEIGLVLAWANETKTAVVPFGGGSGVVGAIAPAGSLVVDLSKLDRISEPDQESRTVTVGAGVNGAALTDHLSQRSYTLGHEPQSVEISTVGGWVATRACGQLSGRYGGIDDLIVALEAVLPNGRVVRSRAVPRRAAGPDVAGLMIGSEGTLGIVSEVTLRIAPSPAAVADRCVRFDRMTDGLAACRSLAQSDLRPTLVRLYDPDDAAILLRNHPDEHPGTLLLLSFDGHDSERRADHAMTLCAGAAGDSELVRRWRRHRNDAVRELRRLMAGEGVLGPHALVDTMEVSSSWTELRALYQSMKDGLGPLTDITGCHVSHVYPGGACLYFTMGSACEDDDAAERLHERWWSEGMRRCLEAGGSISHHHGVGRLRAPWLPEELDGWWPVLRDVKRALDPNSIMNPGALGL